MSTPRKYKAFISYSHADKAWASRLHLRLETFRTPKKIIGGAGRYGDIPSKLTPIFRDRDELPTGSALGPELKRALTNSEFLLVLCSPASANSRWVNEEIRFFRQTHGDDRILAAIVDGEPGAPVGEGLDGCFPPALIEPPEGSDQPREPLAADFRESADGKKLAFQKLAAGMLGAHLDALVQRMAQRRQKRMAQLAGALGTLSLFMGGLAIYATFQRDAAIEQRAIAERERDTANASLDFLISIFEVANPETENPKNITALTILDRGREKIDEELADQPEAQAKILTAMGNVYGNLSELDTAETLFRSALEKDKIAIIDKIENEISLAYLLADTKSSSEALTFIQSAKALIQNAKAQGSISADASSYAEGQLLEAEARVARSLGKTQLAIALYDQARSKLIESSRTKPRELAVVAIRRGTLMASRTDDLKGAQAELASAIEIFRDHLGEDHIETLRAKHNLAFMQFNSELYDLAMQTMVSVLTGYNKILEPTHIYLSRAQLLMGRIEQARGNLAEAVVHFEKSKATTENALGPDNKHVGGRLLYLAIAQAEYGAHSAAIASLDEAQLIYDDLFSLDNFNQGDIRVYRAYVLNKAGKREEAVALCAEGMAILGAAMQPEDSYYQEWAGKCAEIGA